MLRDCNDLATWYAYSGNAQLCQTLLILSRLLWTCLCCSVAHLDALPLKYNKEICKHLYTELIQYDKRMASCQHYGTLVCEGERGSTAVMGGQDSLDRAVSFSLLCARCASFQMLQQQPSACGPNQTYLT